MYEILWKDNKEDLNKWENLNMFINLKIQYH